MSPALVYHQLAKNVSDQSEVEWFVITMASARRLTAQERQRIRELIKIGLVQQH